MENNNIRFPLSEKGGLDPLTGSTGLSQLAPLFCLFHTQKRAGDWSVYQTDRDGMVKAVRCADGAAEFINDSVKAISKCLIYADRAEIEYEGMNGILWLLAGLSELREFVDFVRSDAAFCLTHGRYLKEAGHA